MPKIFCHWSSKFGCVLKGFFFLIFIRCLVRIPMSGGIFVFQGLIMERYNNYQPQFPVSFALSSSIISPSAQLPCYQTSLLGHLGYQLLRQLASTFSCFFFFFLFFFRKKRLLSNKGLRYSASFREKKSIIMLFHSLTLSIHFFCLPPPLPLRSVLCWRVLD